MKTSPKDFLEPSPQNYAAKRLVKCLFCKQQMFYAVDKGHIPEFTIQIEDNHKFKEEHYIHQKCWKTLKAKLFR